VSGTGSESMAASGHGRRDGVATGAMSLGVVVGAGFVAAGVVGWLADATDGDNSDLLFWLVLLLGGGGLVLAGVALLRTRPWASVAAFVVGGLAGSLALFWSVIAPVLAIALVVLGVLNARRLSRRTVSHA